ncbi:exopolyphosphatase [Apiospora arundinis]|uniref:Exopolyphosphatase n=1 Tax=Apiospora arundinis TaxID=335852 RepID=A0ABR2ITA0_9PEZI
MTPRASVKTFLATARTALAAPPSKRQTPLTFVVGNESADLDSLCSAILLAYLRTYAPPHTLHIPLCHIPRDDLSLRPEFTSVLRRAGTSPEDVVTLSELPSPESLSPADTRWLLVDHNALTGQLAQLYGAQVEACVDHHADEGKVPRDSLLRVIEKTGSCASLVVEQCRDAWDALSASSSSASEETRAIDTNLAYLGLGPILIDTSNLQNADKTTKSDIDAAAYLESKLKGGSGPIATTSSASDSSKPYERKSFHDEIAHLKEDITSLSLRDNLRKDYKEWEDAGVRLGTSSVPQDFAFLAKQAGGEDKLAEAIREWAKEKELGLMAVLTTSSNDGKFKREMLVWAQSEKGVQAAQRFDKQCSEELGLSPWSNGKLDLDEAGHWRRCWTQANLKNSRKQIAPMLREALNV